MFFISRWIHPTLCIAKMFIATLNLFLMDCSDPLFNHLLRSLAWSDFCWFLGKGRASHLRTHAAHKRMSIFIWTSIFFSNVLHCLFCIQDNHPVEINYGNDNALSSDEQTVQTDTGSSCILIPDQSNTRKSARGAYNPLCDAWFNKLQTQYGQMLIENNYPAVKCQLQPG